MSSLLLFFFCWIFSLLYISMSSTWFLSRMGLLASPAATFVLPRGCLGGFSVLRCSGQDGGTASVCASGGLLQETGQEQGRGLDGERERVAPASPSCQRCCHACPAVCGSSWCPLAMCDQCHTQMAWPASPLCPSWLCLLRLFSTLIPIKRGGQQDTTPSQNQDHFSC